jgi:hypothetical protein
VPGARTRTKKGTSTNPRPPDQTAKHRGLKTRRDPRYGNRPRATIELGVGQTAILLGEEDLSTWDDEELRQGRRRSSNGSFVGRPPKVIPRTVYLELVERLLAEGHLAILDMLRPSLKVLAQMVDGYHHDEDGERKLVRADDGEWHPIPFYVDPNQLKAVQEVLVRVLGKPETRVSVRAEKKPYQQVQRVEVNRDLGTYPDEVIDVDSTEE